MKLSVVILCLLFCDFSIIAKSEGNECPEKRGGSKVGDSPTVQGYVEEKIEYIYCPENPRIKSQK